MDADPLQCLWNDVTVFHEKISLVLTVACWPERNWNVSFQDGFKSLTVTLMNFDLFPKIKSQHHQILVDLRRLDSRGYCGILCLSSVTVPESKSTESTIAWFNDDELLVEFQNEEIRNPAVMRICYFRRDSRKSFVIFDYIFSGRTGGLGRRGAHRQPQASSTVLLQIQRVSCGELPTPSASDLTLELDQYWTSPNP